MIKPISKKKYYETISEQIEQAILSGEWAEGSRVPTEDELASIFQVGRGSIREAITNLQMSGVLFSSPGIGTYVADNAVACINNNHLADMLNDTESISEIVDARQIIEPYLAGYAAENAGAGDIKKMESALNKAKSAKSPEEWERVGHLFHVALIQACGNKILISLFESLEETSRKKGPKIEMSEEKIEQTVDAYQSILDAVKEKNGNLASERMAELLK